MTSQKPRAIIEEPRLSKLHASVAGLVKRTDQARITLSKEDDWVAVPVQGAAHLGEAQVQHLHEAWRELGCRVAFAVLLEPLRGVPDASESDTSLDGLNMFNRDFAHFNVALYTPTPKAIVICTTDDYFVVAGTEKFVTLAVGGAISDAYARFAIFGSEAGWSEKERAFFSSILTALRDEYPGLQAGTSLTFPSSP
jgi:hypothetical protein